MSVQVWAISCCDGWIDAVYSKIGEVYDHLELLASLKQRVPVAVYTRHGHYSASSAVYFSLAPFRWYRLLPSRCHLDRWARGLGIAPDIRSTGETDVALIASYV
jgi:hypothetical protein